MSGIHADIIGLAEINQDTTQYAIQHKLETVANKYFDHKKLVYGTSARKARRHYKPGGTMMMTVMDTVSVVKSTSRDRMGRWVTTQYQANTKQRLTIVIAYQVCQKHITGHNTAANQQIHTIIEESVAQGINTRLNPRQAFIHDLSNFVRQRQSEGDSILLIGDFNETIDQPQSGMATLASKCGLIDLFGNKLGNTRIPSTYKRGNRRLDYALITPAILPAVRNVGYDPFDYRGIASDHRGLYIDIALEHILGDRLRPLEPASHRDFTANNPNAVLKYVNKKHDELCKHNILERLTRLEQLTEPDNDLAERIDRDVVRASIIAAKAAKQRYKSPWSPELAKAWASIHLYRMLRSQLQNPKLNNWPTIKSWQTRYDGPPDELPTTIPEIEERLKAAHISLRSIRQQAEATRQQYLDEKAMLYAALEQKSKEHIVRRLKRAEALHRCYQKLRFIRRDEADSGLSELQIPADPSMDPKACPPHPDHWQTITMPEQITTLLIDRNRKHFGQAEGTPLTDPAFVAEVKYDGSGMTADLILEGEYRSEKFNEATTLFVEHMTKKTTEELKPEITKEEFFGKLKKWSETTSTSPSGIHLGHYHALWKTANIDEQKNPDEATQFEAKRELLLRAQLALLNYAIKFGYSYTRWQKIVNVMLKKDPSNSRIHRLRVIHLYEADYNLLLAVKWRQAIHHAEDHALLNNGLYGSRPGRSAHEPAFIELMQNEIYKASMKSGLNKDLDATSCYDRILTWLASICSRRMGIHRQIAAVNCRTLEQAKYHLKTSLGVSEHCYQHCTIHPIHGTGQGSGNSPQIWCFVASTLFDAFAEQAHGAKFYSYDGKYSLQLFMVGFVDDCSQRVNCFHAHPQPTAAELVALMTKDAQLWNDLLWASGGALEVPKCSFQVIQTNWSSRGKPFLQGSCTAPPLAIQTPAGTLQVRQASCYQTRRSLGIHFSPSGTMKKQVEILIAKSKKYATEAMSNSLSRSEARMLYHGIYIPSITYPFPLTSMTEGQCHAIETPFLQAILPRCGYNRSMSRWIRFAPVTHGGAGFLPLYVEQTVHNILTAIKHLRCPDQQPGSMLTIALSWAQAHVGVSWPIWKFPKKKTPYLPNPWIVGVKSALAKIDATIVLGESYVPKILRRNDWYIMDEALNLGTFNAGEIEDINAYRRYYQATTAADIVNDRGDCIREDIWEGNGVSTPQDFNQEYFNQQRPDAHARRTWRRFLRTKASNDRKLLVPLQNWLITYGICRRRPSWVFDLDTKRLFHRINANNYVICMRDGHYYSIPTDNHSYHVPPLSAYPTDVYRIGQKLLVRDNFDEIHHHLPPAQTFQEFIRTLDPWEYQLLENTVLNEDPTRLVTLLNEGSILFLSSDGSVLDGKYGSFGFTVTHVTSKRRLVLGQGPVPGHAPSSFRAEAYGVLAVGRLLLRLSEYTGIVIRQCVCHWIDNEGTVKRIRSELRHTHHYPNLSLQPDWDVIHEIGKTFLSMPTIQYKPKWIKSHQDSTTPYRQLSLAAQTNCDADTLASEFHSSPQGQRYHNIVPVMPNTSAHLIVQGRTVTGKYKTAIRHTAILPSYYGYLQERFQWNVTTIHKLDWELLSTLVSSYDDQRPTIVKHLHGIAPTGKYIHRYNTHTSAKCPSCPCEEETNNHIIQCHSPTRARWRLDTLHKLKATIKNTSTDKTILAILLMGIQCSFHDEQAYVSTQEFPVEYHQLLMDQNEIGWLQLFRGRWAKEWTECYTTHAVANNHERPSAEASKWVRQCGHILLSQWCTLWKLRNEEQHNKSSVERMERVEAETKSRLAELYQYKLSIMPVDRQLYPYATAAEHLQRPESMEAKLAWCHDVTPAIHASLKQASTLGPHANQNIQATLHATQCHQYASPDQQVACSVVCIQLLAHEPSPRFCGSPDRKTCI